MATFAFMGKPWFVCACLLLLASLASGQETSRNPTKPGAATPVNPITDLVLIYDGAEDRMPWTVDRFRPYVYREADGKIEWLYDGFLFLDRLAKSGRRLSPITNRKDATKADWQDLMDHYLQTSFTNNPITSSTANRPPSAGSKRPVSLRRAAARAWKWSSTRTC
jgi:hypothetical protein